MGSRGTAAADDICMFMSPRFTSGTWHMYSRYSARERMLTTPPVGDPYQPALGRIKSNAGLVGASIKGRWLLYRLKVIRRIIILYKLSAFSGNDSPHLSTLIHCTAGSRAGYPVLESLVPGPAMQPRPGFIYIVGKISAKVRTQSFALK